MASFPAAVSAAAQTAQRTASKQRPLGTSQGHRELLHQLFASIISEVSTLEQLEPDPSRSLPELQKLQTSASDAEEKEDLEDEYLALTGVEALLADREVLNETLLASDHALEAMLSKLSSLRAQVQQLASTRAETRELQDRLARERAAREALVRENARLYAKNSELTGILYESLEAEGDVQREALIDALAIENHALWKMVGISQVASRAVVNAAPTVLGPFKLPNTPSPSKARQARRLRRTPGTGSTASENTPPARPSSPVPAPEDERQLEAVDEARAEVPLPEPDHSEQEGLSEGQGAFDFKMFKLMTTPPVSPGAGKRIDLKEETSRAQDTSLEDTNGRQVTAVAASGKQDIDARSDTSMGSVIFLGEDADGKPAEMEEASASGERSEVIMEEC